MGTIASNISNDNIVSYVQNLGPAYESYIKERN